MNNQSIDQSLLCFDENQEGERETTKVEVINLIKEPNLMLTA